MRQAVERAQGVAHAVERCPALERGRRSGQRVGDVVRHRSRQLVDPDQVGAVGGPQHAVVDMELRRPIEPEGHGAHVVTDMGHHRRIVEVGDRDAPVGSEIGPDPRLGLLVVRQRAMTVEVVGREVEPRGHGRLEALRMAEPERRGLDDEDVDLGVVDGLDQRNLGVADRTRPPPGGDEHVGDHRGDRRLPVGAGHRDQRSVVPLAGQVELAHDVDAGPPRRVEHGVGVGYARARQQRIDPRDEVVELRARRSVEQVHTRRFCCHPAGGRGMVVDHEHVAAVRPQRPGDRPSGDPVAHHQGASGHPAAQ